MSGIFFQFYLLYPICIVVVINFAIYETAARVTCSLLFWCMWAQMGLIAGGLADGGVLLWDADRLTRGGSKSDAAQLSRLSKHTGAVRPFFP